MFLEPSCCNKRQKKVQGKKLIWGIGDVCWFWMILNSKQFHAHLGPVYSPNQFALFFFCFLQQEGSKAQILIICTGSLTRFYWNIYQLIWRNFPISFEVQLFLNFPQRFLALVLKNRAKSRNSSYLLQFPNVLNRGSC